VFTRRGTGSERHGRKTGVAGSAIVSTVLQAPGPPPPGFAPALVGAVHRANIGVVVAVESGGDFRCNFANECVVSLVGKLPRRVPEDLGFVDEDERSIRAFLASDGPGAITLDSVGRRGATDAGVLRVVASKVKKDGRRAAVLFLYDVFARSVAERALAESEARFRRLLDAAPDGIVLSTLSRFIYANPALVRLLGYSKMEELIATPVARHVHPADLPSARRIARDLLARGEPQVTGRLRVLRKDHGVVELDVRAISIEWDGEVALLAIARDMTERKRIQAQLIHADRLGAMGTLAAGVAHEINNPLAYLMLNIQYLMRELPRFDGDRARLSVLLERLGEAEHGARRVSAIVSDLRTFGRPERTDRGPVSVVDAVSAAVKITAPHFRHRAKVCESYDGAPVVDASAVRLEQVFVNLLVNAAQAIPDGDPDGNEVTVRVRRDEGRVVVEVTDTGAGIPAGVIDRVFDPFFTTKPRGVGTGLGLPTSLGIVTSLGGEITVSSTAGVGTTFRVFLPALPANVRAAESTVPPTPADMALPKPSRMRLLVVDDEPLVADMLRRALSEEHDVTVTTDAKTALDHLLGENEVDLIFCDLLMPKMSGMDLYDELRSKRPGVEQRMVFMTGGAFTERAAQFLSVVPNPKMSKPFDLREIERVLLRARTKK
jgi:PAS domain S-box-containing protein